MAKDIYWLKQEVLNNKFDGCTIHIDKLFELIDEIDTDNDVVEVHTKDGISTFYGGMNPLD